VARRDVVVMGASAGGVDALKQVTAQLEPNLAAALFVVMHVSSERTSVLPSILNRVSALEAVHARDGEPVRHSRIYVAPPGRHLLLARGRVRLVAGPRENGHRPAVDPLFRTAAWSYGTRTIGVVLSGLLDDGTAGMLEIKRHGGVAVVQDPEDATYGGMPRSVLDAVAVDHVLAAGDIAALLRDLVREEVSGNGGDPAFRERAGELPEMELMMSQTSEERGDASGFTCPECNGVLYEPRDGDLLRFRCRVGHAYSPDTLSDEQGKALEAALWSGLRALEESVALSERLAERARRGGHQGAAQRFERQVRNSEERAALIRRVLFSRDLPAEAAAAAAPAASDSASPETGDLTRG
jgi:two-component system chemotaxis response regulator CheB